MQYGIYKRLGKQLNGIEQSIRKQMLPSTLHSSDFNTKAKAAHGERVVVLNDAGTMNICIQKGTKKELRQTYILPKITQNSLQLEI